MYVHVHTHMNTDIHTHMYPYTHAHTILLHSRIYLKPNYINNPLNLAADLKHMVFVEIFEMKKAWKSSCIY